MDDFLDNKIRKKGDSRSAAGRKITTHSKSSNRNKRGKKRHSRKKSWLSPTKVGISVAGLFICIGIVLFFVFYFQKVEKKVVVESGVKLIEASQFLKHQSDSAAFVTDISQIDLSLPGTHPITLKVNGTEKEYSSQLVIQDTIPPQAEAITVWLYPGQAVELEPSDFITAVKDFTPVTVSFEKQPDLSKTGTQSVTIVLEDAGANVTKIKTSLIISNIRTDIKVEAGIKGELTIEDFLLQNDSSAQLLTDISLVSMDTPGYFDVRIKVNDEIHNCHVEVTDTMAPQVNTKKDLTLWKGQELNPEEMIESYWDASEVSIYFLDGKEPDVSSEGIQYFSIVLEDEYGNKTMVDCEAKVETDTEPPQIYGAEDRTVYLEEKVAYKQGIVVEDNSQLDIEVEVDTSQMDITQLGTYPVTYTAKDISGNTSTVTVEFTVIEKDADAVTESDALLEADKVLNTIIEEGMTEMEQLKAIYNWARTTIYYSGTSDKTNWYIGAYQGFTTLSGDCYTYYAIGKAMMERLGIENIDITNKEGASRHYWSMVNLGDGWYHYDLTPRVGDGDDFCLVTDEFLTSYSAVNDYSHDWDRDKYPETPVTDAADNGTLGVSLSSLPEITEDDVTEEPDTSTQETPVEE